MDIIYCTIGLLTKVAINIKKISQPVKRHPNIASVVY